MFKAARESSFLLHTTTTEAIFKAGSVVLCISTTAQQNLHCPMRLEPKNRKTSTYYTHTQSQTHTDTQLKLVTYTLYKQETHVNTFKKKLK